MWVVAEVAILGHHCCEFGLLKEFDRQLGQKSDRRWLIVMGQPVQTCMFTA